ncbi:DUF4314 domain-containing protein [Clostridium sp. AF50-3]|uniref:DUF4314 domain-containing protein n=1 Tax=Clostridium sp. AF50-3 TaxID=2293021 RepID=UPI001FA9CCD3|nr:DUF4314 domain-containing protein [Clostridium sp. AF50-3]
MMGKSMREQVEQARREFPPGTRIRLIRMVPPEPQPVEPGTMGTVRSVDGGANVWVNWDNGRSGIAVIYGVDEFVKIEEEKE